MKFLGIIFFTLVLTFCPGCDIGDQLEPLTNEQSEAFNYIPKESDFVLFLNLNELRRSDLWQEYFKNSLDISEKQNWLSEFESAADIRLGDGIGEVYLAASWAGNNLFIVRFEKNINKIKNYFNSAFDSSLINSKKIYFKKSDPLSQYYFASDTLLIIVNNQNTIASITSDSFKSIKENNEMMLAINNIQKKKYYWMVTDKSNYAYDLISGLMESGASEELRNIFSSIKSVSLYASFELGAEFASILQLSNDKDAFLLSVAVRSAISNYTSNNSGEGTNEIINNLKVKRNNDKVSLELKVDKENLSDIQNLLKQKME